MCALIAGYNGYMHHDGYWDHEFENRYFTNMVSAARRKPSRQISSARSLTTGSELRLWLSIAEIKISEGQFP